MNDFKCNACGAVQDTTDWLENGGCDGDEFEVECDECEEAIEVRTVVEVSYENLANRY